jgi:hypothetical protein
LVAVGYKVYTAIFFQNSVSLDFGIEGTIHYFIGYVTPSNKPASCFEMGLVQAFINYPYSSSAHFLSFRPTVDEISLFFMINVLHALRVFTAPARFEGIENRPAAFLDPDETFPIDLFPSNCFFHP